MKNCIHCKKKFKDTTSNLNKKYCSYSCKVIYNNKGRARLFPNIISKNCKICNKSFEDTTKKKHQKYCSKKCHDKNNRNSLRRKLYSKKYATSDKRKESIKKYDQSDKGRRINNHHCALYHARKIMAIPKWANLEEIKKIYLKRKEGFHVDHIIPLKGKNVCGLHVANNLRVITATANLVKGNNLY